MATPPHTILGIDCAGQACTVVLRRGEVTLASAVECMRHGQAERLVPIIENVLHNAGLTPVQLDAIGATVGPGGFTGVRIGLATARGYALGLSIPVIGTSRFRVFAGAAGDVEGPLLAAVDIRRDDVALQWFAGPNCPLGDAWTATPEAMADTLDAAPVPLVGDAAERIAAALRTRNQGADIISGTARIDANALGRVLAETAREDGGTLPRPLYLRDADVTPAPNPHVAKEMR
jgi:tRNA threonylcarbamoyladenosine biosynthesis protein TsaB